MLPIIRVAWPTFRITHSDNCCPPSTLLLGEATESACETRHRLRERIRMVGPISPIRPISPISPIRPGGPDGDGNYRRVIIAVRYTNRLPALQTALEALGKGKPAPDGPGRLKMHTNAHIQAVLACVVQALGSDNWFVQDYATSECFGDRSLRTHHDRPCRDER